MRILAGTQAQDQYRVNQNPVYKVEIKPSEDSEEDYEDITYIVLEGSIKRNSEAKPNTASLQIINTEGLYDIVNVMSATRSKFKSGAKVKIYLGFGSPDNLLFTGYIKEGYDPTYARNKEETITITLSDRSDGTEAIDYTENNVNTIEYSPMTLNQNYSPVNGEFVWSNEQTWNVKQILEHVLVVYGGMDLSDIDIDNELAELQVPKAQFVEESIWDIVQLCCQTKMHIGYFDVDGKFKTKPVQFDSLDWNYRTSDGSTTQSIAHSWSTKNLASRVCVTGGVNFYGAEPYSLVVYNTDPFAGVWGTMETFNQFAPNGNIMYDALRYNPNVSDADKIYGIGHQGYLTPRYGAVRSLSRAEIGDSALWDKVVQGPFPWTVEGYPCEPYQTIKTGIGDGADMGADGYFKKWNMQGGTTVLITPSTLTCTGDGRYKQYPHIMQALCSLSNMAPPPPEPDPSPMQRSLFYQWYGILPSKEVWDSHWELENEKYGAPLFDYPLNTDDYDGPSSELYYVFTYNLLDAWLAELFFAIMSEYMGNTMRDLGNMYYKVWQWGLKFAAETIELPSTNWTGTSTDTELFAKYGERKSQNIENPLLFGTTACEFVATKILERLKYMSIIGGFTRTLQLELECGDLVDYYNNRIECVETLTTTQCSYSFGRNKKNTMITKGGIIRSNGTTLKAWE